MFISSDIAISGGMYMFANSGIGGGGGPTGTNNVVGFTEMNPPVIAGQQLQDPTATINDPVGFTINDDTLTGVAIGGLTASNQNWFTANYTTVPGFYTCAWGPGSTVASSPIQVVNVGASLVFFIQAQSGAATYNYPFTFSV